MLLASLGLGGGLASLHAAIQGPDVVPGSRVVLEGEIQFVKVVEGGVQLGLQVARVSGSPSRFRAQLFGAAAPELDVGARIAVEAKLKPIVPTSNPGEWNGWRRALGRGQPYTVGVSW